MFNFFHRKSSSQGQAPELFFHTDMHCHLVPGVDDGQQAAVGGAQLIEAERRWGVRHIILTPHVTQDTFENTPETLAEPYRQLQQAVAERGVATDVKLEMSAEYRLDGFFNDEMEKGNLRPLPNKYLLVENSYVQEPWQLDSRLFNLKMQGYAPILAHPERYPYYFEKPERYEEIHNTGTLFQINLLSLAGNYGKHPRRIAEMLIERDMVDFVGTDMHTHAHAQTIERYLTTKDYRRHAEQLAPRILNDKVFL